MITLKNILLVNSLSSGMTGLLLVAMPKTIAEIFGAMQSWPFMATGVFLVLFALLVFIAASIKQINRTLVSFIIFLDTLWVVASLLIVIPQLFGISLLGYVLISGVAGWVGLMAYLQSMGLRKAMSGIGA